jgi:hypothetical protein
VSLSERMKSFVAFRLAPRWLVYWCSVKAAAHVTVGEWGNDHPDDVSVIDMLTRLEDWA